ncbi:hypothetical protein SDC9_122089 [bioreactor metagenome]|uniref:Dinitrogenase iron-molybdenum cofactor biosynthesis domain-containing protein n=1 Tax=bioreactor metagenome TaxID=1076179 RepID=A0A645CDW6_9ZZZZ
MVALTIWSGRIAPVFDVAGRLLIADGPDRREHTLRNAACLHARIAELKELGVDVLICGAISRPARMLAESRGIRVYGFIAGDRDEVLNAWMRNELESEIFAMPGCARRRQCRRRCRKWND